MTAEAAQAQAAPSAAESDSAVSETENPEVADSEASQSGAAAPAAEVGKVDPDKDEQAKDQEADDEAEAKETVEQFRREARHRFAHSANVMNTADVTGDMVAGNKFITVYSGAALPKMFTIGPLPAARLTMILERFARSAEHDELVRRVRADRVLVLRGSRGSGRRTGAIGVLADAQQDRQPFLVLDPTVPPNDLIGQLQPGASHLITDFSTSADDPLRQHHLDAIQEHLRAHGGYAIITMDLLATMDRALEEQHDWRPPSADDILRAHLAADCPHPPEAERALDLEETRAFLGIQPTPSEIERYAQTLIGYLDGQQTVQDLANCRIRAAEDHARRAFADTNDSLREKAFLLSLAVFDRLDYPTIAEAGDTLYRAFAERQTPAEPAGLTIFDTSHLARLDRARASEHAADADEDLASPTLTAFRNPFTWSVVLRHVWLEHPTARDPIRSWLRALGASAPRASRVRAALAAGFLASVDFPSIADPLLARWAGSALLGQRQAAAWALFAAVQQGAEPAVLPLLQRWADGGVARRWTVVHTVDALADLRNESTIPLLSEIAQKPTDNPRLKRELERVAARLLTSPIALEALDALVDWSQEDGFRRDLAHRAFVNAADEQDDIGRPALLTYGTSDPLARTALTTLWRAALNNPAVRDDARRSLSGWVLLAAEDEPLEPELRRLFTDLAASANERSRLDYLLRHLPPDVPPTALQVAERIRTRLLDK